MATFTLTGTGQQALSSPASLSITITDAPADPEQGNAEPTNWYHLGLLRLGNALGFLPAFPLDATTMLVPCVVGTTLLGYKLHPAVEIEVEERAEVLQYVGALGSSQSPPPPNIITPFSAESLGTFLAATDTANPASGVWILANRAFYYPFQLSAPFTCTRALWSNGTVVSGNIDVGVYDSSFVRLGHTGSTAQGAISTTESAALALTLPPGRYYLAASMDNVTARLLTAVLALQKGSLTGSRAEASAFPLPANATPIVPTGVGNIYAIGIANFQP